MISLRRRRDEPADEPWKVRGPVVIDLEHSSPQAVEQLEPRVNLRTALEWGGFMDGTMELTDDGLVWIPSEHARRFGFDAFRLLPDDIIDIRVIPRPVGGEIDIDLTQLGRISVKVNDPEPWADGIETALGA
jgi:hypothetical protein